MADTDVLADPIDAALRGPHASLAVTSGRVSRYRRDIAPFLGHPADLTRDDYDDIARLTAGDGVALLRDRRTPLPDGWRVKATFGLVLYTGTGLDTAPDPEARPLGDADVPAMTALVDETKPGPFRPRTIDFGGYLGVHDASGGLIAMAGRRMRPPGWIEISAVCTAPSARGRGLASRLVRAVGDGIRTDGTMPFLHTSADSPARRLYEDLGFVVFSEVPLEIVRVPERSADSSPSTSGFRLADPVR